MFEFLKTKQKTKTLVMEQPSKLMEPKINFRENPNGYPIEVLEIHHEFETAADRLLIEANKIIKESESKDCEKVSRLEKLGFNQTKQVVELKPLLEKAVLSKEQIDLLHKYFVKYPNNKFITEDQVKQICFKYGLVCGGVSKFKGFVPEKNLRDIEKFGVKKEDLVLECIETGRWPRSGDSKTFFIKNAEIRPSASKGFWHIYEIGETDKYKYAFQSNDGVNFYSSDIHNIFELSGISDVDRFRVSKSGFKICAPVKDMDMRDMTIEGGYKMQEIVKFIPDPVVLQPVYGGYLIITAWGDESTDELVVNQNFN